MKNNVLKIIIYSLIIIVVVFIIWLLINSLSSELVFKLNGEEHIAHNLNDEYQDLGVTIKKGNKDLSNEVVINNNVDVHNEGNYIITYSFQNKVLTRYVEVKKINVFSLNGDSDVYLLLNGTYSDPKVDAFDNGIDYANEVEINSNIDASKTGKYQISYTTSKNAKVLIRNIYVSEFDDYFKISYDKDTIQDAITLKITIDEDKISKYTLPDGSTKTQESDYIITKNGEYTFVIYDKYNNQLEKKIHIKNVKITNPMDASCVATIENGSTTIKVTVNKEITKYVYNGIEKNESTYVINKEEKDNKVELYADDGDTKEITCSTKIIEPKKLEIHFIASGYYDDAILIRTPKTTIFIDGGRGKDRVVAYLKELKISKIDYLIGSHTEYDHINAHGAIMRNFKVGTAIYPNNIKSCGCSCERNDVWEVINAASATGTPVKVQGVPSVLSTSDMNIYFIEPTKIGCNKNNNSFVFILVYGNNKFMFTGDADSVLHNVDTLNNTAKKLGLASGIQVDVFKYPHHGNQMLDTKLINALNVKAIIVPNYNAPQYGEATYFRNRGIEVYRQSDSTTGNILIASDGNKITYTMNIAAKNYVWN